MKTVLITAYAVNPYKGSEDGTGWNISRELAKDHKVYVVTRKNNRPEIEFFFEENEFEGKENMTFLYYDLPYIMRFWKKKLGERGYVLYFYLWQLFLPFFILRNKVKFDLAHALNFHSDSHPHFLWILGKPVFWGPIGHHPPVPYRFIRPTYALKNLIKDRLYNTVKFCMRNFDPFFYIAKWTSRKIFVINSQVNLSVRANPEKIVVLPAVANEVRGNERTAVTKSDFTVLAVGRFVYMKGFDITIRAFAKYYHSQAGSVQKQLKLKLVGKGEELENLQNLIREEGIEAVTEVIQWVEKSEMSNIYQGASLFVFGSHEGAGMVIPEALSYGLPIVCFDNCGPGELCSVENAIKVPYQSYEKSIDNFSQAISELFENKEKYDEMSKNACDYAQQHFSWNTKRVTIQEAYASFSKKEEESLKESITLKSH